MLVVPEGGFGEPAISGIKEIAQLFNLSDYSFIALASGTGATAAGIAVSATENQQTLAISVLKNNLSLENDIYSLIGKNRSIKIFHDFHCGGYAKHHPELISFMNRFYQQTGIPTDFVYTGKLALALITLAEQDYFPENSRVLMIHSGGLQGNRSLARTTLIF